MAIQHFKDTMAIEGQPDTLKFSGGGFGSDAGFEIDGKLVILNRWEAKRLADAIMGWFNGDDVIDRPSKAKHQTPICGECGWHRGSLDHYNECVR